MSRDTAVVAAALEHAYRRGFTPSMNDTLFASLATALTERAATKLLLSLDQYEPEGLRQYMESFARDVLDWQRQHL